MDRLAIHYNDCRGTAAIDPGAAAPATRLQAGVYWCLAPAFASLLGGLVYLNALHNPFVYDDHHTVVENGSIADITNLQAIVLGAITRPIVNLSYAVDRAIWGQAAPFGFHVTNVLLHMLNIVLVFSLARQFGKSRGAAFASAALLAVHPMMSEAVGYVSGRSEVLCATFFVIALMCGRRWLHDGARWAPLTIAAWMAALATKESAAMLPFVLLAADYFTVGGDAATRRRRLLTVHAPLVGFALIGGIARLFVLARIEYPGQVALHWNYVLLGVEVIQRYLAMMAVPSGQTIFHSVAPSSWSSPHAWLACGVVAAVVGLAFKLRRDEPFAGLGLLWFLLVLMPSTVLIALDQGEPMAEHRVYLASCGLFLAAGSAIAYGIERIRRERNRGAVPVLASLCLGLVLASFGTMTIVRNAVWADPVRLWRESADLAPAHYRPRLLLGEALQDAGRCREALEQYRIAIRLRPTEPVGYVKEGQCLAETGQWTEARQQFLRALDIEPGHQAAVNSLTVLDHLESRFGIDSPRR